MLVEQVNDRQQRWRSCWVALTPRCTRPSAAAGARAWCGPNPRS